MPSLARPNICPNTASYVPEAVREEPTKGIANVSIDVQPESASSPIV